MVWSYDLYGELSNTAPESRVAVLIEFNLKLIDLKCIMYFFHSCLVSHCEHAWFTWIIGYKWGYCDSLPLTALLMMFCNPLKFNNSTLQIGCISIGLYPVVNSVNCEQKWGVHTRSNIHFLKWTLSDVTKGTNISHCYSHPHHHQGRLYSSSCMSPIPNMWKVQQTINFSRKLKLSIACVLRGWSHCIIHCARLLHWIPGGKINM